MALLEGSRKEIPCQGRRPTAHILQFWVLMYKADAPHCIWASNSSESFPTCSNMCAPHGGIKQYDYHQVPAPNLSFYINEEDRCSWAVIELVSFITQRLCNDACKSMSLSGTATSIISLFKIENALECPCSCSLQYQRAKEFPAQPSLANRPVSNAIYSAQS